MSKVTPEGMAFFMKRRHSTSDPWTLVEALGVDVKWTDILSGDKLGWTGFPPFGAPVIYFSTRVKYSSIKTRVLAHELGLALLHDGVGAYYSTAATKSIKLNKKQNDLPFNC